MFRCEDCRKLFETPNSEQDFVGYYGSAPAYQTIGVCPHCKSTEIYEVEEECDDEGIKNSLEIEEFVDSYGDEMSVTYSIDWYYENCTGKCGSCKFYKYKECMWEV